MRLNINLATQPYEDARRFTALWTGILGALLLSAIVISFFVVKRWGEYRQLSHAIEVEKNVLQDLDTKQAQDLAILNRPENQDVRQRSDFLNELILRKEISWTNIFTTLEKMMPPHLRVLSVQPKVVQDKILINLQLGGDSRDRTAELVRRMERSKTFRNAQVLSEVDSALGGGQIAPGQQQQDPMRFVVQAEYIPGAAESEAATTESEGGQ